ncbi:MAG: NUDIX domain-containing protein [Dehalococcoidia bacterium]|uniref:NUDIX hydrolase n=1 Tax=Candidatus Amarobacter glycogenicus TaxID=3140699 RepID=UPI0031346A8B|nr:NUDIX domain-containing protein [Dehalococcoidia bacterium]MBK8559032.1 NUDIX domain-containing protein [Dehalococcoidia bacterium]
MTAGPFERHHTATAYVVAQGRTLLLWHHKLRMWLPPGGHLEPNEDPVQGATREAFEESGLEVEVIAPPDLLVVDSPAVVPPPAVILIEDIVRPDQPFHQHIDHVYFTRSLHQVDFAHPIPHGPSHWFTAEELAESFSLPAPDGTLVPVAEDVRLLGLRALIAAQQEP